MRSERGIARHPGPALVTFNSVGMDVLSQDEVFVPASCTGVAESTANNRGIRYSAAPSDMIAKRYQVAGFIAEGDFGAVYKATDLYTGTVVAVKVCHKGQLPHRDIETEEQTYRKLVAGCSADIRLFAEVMGSGEHDGHRFLVLEMCGPTLLHLISAKKMVPIPRRHVQEIAFQLIQGVAYMHSLGLIHTDLKPDNIALRHSGRVSLRYFDPVRGFRTYHRLVSTQICILDLGGVVEESEDGNEGSVGAIGYRAPEISLGMPFDHTADIFAVGCVLAEVHMNRELFPDDIASDREHVALVERICGPFSLDFAADVEQLKPGSFHIQDGTVSARYPGQDFDANVHAEPLLRLQNAKPITTRIHDIKLGSLLKKLLDPDPSKRLELNQALRHTYFDVLRCRQL